MTMSRYDEDLYDNPFYTALEKNYHLLLDQASSSHLIVCVPKYELVKDASFSKTDFGDHILLASTDQDDSFTSLTKHHVQILQGQIILGKGYKVAKEVAILFEETFYNSKDESYRVLCVSEVFNRAVEKGNANKSTSPDYSRLPTSYNEFYQLLWGLQGSAKTKENLDKLLLTFCIDYQKFSGPVTPTLVDLVSGQVTRAMQLVLKDSLVKRHISQSDQYISSLKISVENYLMNVVHKHLFATITNCMKSNDSNLNKKNRNLVDTRLEHLHVRAEYEENLPGSRKELSKLNDFSTPFERLQCLKRVVTLLTRPVEAAKSDESLMMATDDLLPLLIYLIIRSPIPNWFANLTYMKHFILTKVAESDEFSFYLATLEAALHFILSGNVKSSKPTQRKPDGGVGRQASTGSFTSAKEKFFQYVQYGDEAAVRLMLKGSRSSSSDDVFSKLCHPLCDCETCLELTASVDSSGAVTPMVRDDMGRTALHLAALYGQAGLIDILSKNGCLADASDFLGRTPLHMAALKGHQNIILLLVHFGGEVRAVDNEGNTPLHLCAKNGHEDCVKAILFLDSLKSRVDVNAGNDMGETPLHLAAKWGYDGIVHFLLECEADPRVRNRRRQAPMDVAQNADIKKALQSVMDEGPPLVISQKESVGGFQVIDVRSRKDVPMVDNSSKAVMSPVKPAVASLDRPNAHQIERLFKAIKQKDLPLVQFYLGWVEDTSPLPSPDQVTMETMCHPLCQCVKCVNIQRHSMKDALEIDCRNKKGFSPLHICVIENNFDVFEILLMKGALLDIQTTKHITPLHLACYHDRQKMVEELVNHGASVNIHDQHGEIPLHLACARSSPAIVQLLLEKSSFVNVGNVDGYTPLHQAAHMGHTESVKILLKFGASPSRIALDQKTPLDMAKTDEIKTLLKNYIANHTTSVGCSNTEAVSQEDGPVPHARTSNDSPFTEVVAPITTSNSTDQINENNTSDDNDLFMEEHGLSARYMKRSQTVDSYGSRTGHSRKQLTLSIEQFDKLKQLKRSQTFDHSSPKLDSTDVKFSISIKHFDRKNSLKHVEMVEKSSPVLESLKLPLSIRHFDTGSLHHVEPVDKSSPLYIYSLCRDTSWYDNYADTPTANVLGTTFFGDINDESHENGVVNSNLVNQGITDTQVENGEVETKGHKFDGTNQIEVETRLHNNDKNDCTDVKSEYGTKLEGEFESCAKTQVHDNENEIEVTNNCTANQVENDIEPTRESNQESKSVPTKGNVQENTDTETDNTIETTNELSQDCKNGIHPESNHEKEINVDVTPNEDNHLDHDKLESNYEEIAKGADFENANKQINNVSVYNMAEICDKYTSKIVTLNGTMGNELLETKVESENDTTVKEDSGR
ncbi:ankyrin repeat domain-containing protein 27-like isoform X4 [Dreissena polymorpha]|uniref:ankyrin repeat domain-containing protein 27-like isoform X4 n=1 Tax=Dreissena polymorpha TaxID=45954 RepID=UPI00226429B9|nr:ankyrin repeat domain-containing protein 27-like isoform X4 [Dreissena polymorpha]